jgi:putative nucleotidyltransferase-like protein
MVSILRSWLTALPDDPTSLEEITKSFTVADWSDLLEYALFHGLIGVVAPHVDRLGVPEEIRDRFDRRYAISRAFQESAGKSLERIASMFNEAGIRSCALKGPALAARLYGDPAVRQGMDIDLLITPDDFARASAAMEDLGYAGKSQATVAYLLRHSHHLTFAKPGVPLVELHFHAYAGFGVTLPASALMERAVPYRFTDRSTVLVPAAEDEFVYLALHAAGHSFARLIWLYDLKLLLLRNPDLDWELVVHRAHDARVGTAVGYAARLLEDWLSVPLADVAATLLRRSVRRGAADVLLPYASQVSSRAPMDNLKGLLFTAMLCDRLPSTVWLLQHHLLRSVRRRAHRVAPQVLPQSWSG